MGKPRESWGQILFLLPPDVMADVRFDLQNLENSRRIVPMTIINILLVNGIWGAVMLPKCYLPVQEANLSAVVARAHGKMNPVAPVFVLFDKELVEILMDLFRVTNQDKGILDSLLCPITANVNGTTCKVIGGRYTTDFLV